MQFLETLHPIIFVSQIIIKDVSAKQMLKLTYTEFSDARLESVGISPPNFEELSYEVKMFSEKMDQNTNTINFHYH